MDTPSAPIDPAISAECEYKAGEIVFDDYEIMGKVGSGAMGIVYQAKNTALHRMVALKVLPKSISSNTVIRFQNEARALGRLQSDNIASIFDLKIAGDGTPYLALQFIEGPTLAQLIEENRALPLADFLSFFSTICDALAHAHARNVIHRDIKPSNIILEDRDGKLTPVIVDFGIAKLQNVDERLTQSGSCLGTPLYASPEQAQAKPISDKSDMYSVGCLMFHCLVGVPPFSGDSALETLAMHVDEEPPFRFLEGRADLPKSIALLIHRLLDKDPLNRPSADETCRLLNSESILLAEVEADSKEKTDDKPTPVQLSNVTALERTRRRPLAIAIFAAVAAVVILSLGVTKIPYLSSKVGSKERIKVKAIGGDPLNPKKQKSRLERTLDRFSDGNIQLRAGDLLALADEDLEIFETISSNPIRQLQLSDNIDLTDKGLIHLKNLHDLTLLKIAGTKAKKLDYLKGMNNLRVLDLSATMIDNKSLEALKGLKELDRLFLKETTISDLSVLKNFLQLTELNLEFSRNITDDSLNQILTLPHLQNLNLSSTSVSDAGLKKLAALKSLKHVIINNCPDVTLDGINKIEKSMPNCLFSANTTDDYQAQWKEASQLIAQKKYDKGISMFKTTLSRMDKEKRLSPPLLTRGMAGLADAQEKAGHPEDSTDSAIVAARNATEGYLQRRIAALLDKLMLELYERPTKRADSCMKAVCEVYGKLDKDPALTRTTGCWTIYLSKLFKDKKFNQTIEECQSVLSMLKGAGLEDTEMTGQVLGIKASAEFFSGNPAAAKHYEKAIRLMEKTRPSHCPQALVGCYHGLALASMKENKIEDAIVNERTAIKTARLYKHPELLPELYKLLQQLRDR